MAFNKHLSFYKNITLGLWSNGKSIEQMADEISTTEASIRTVIGSRFKRGGKTPPLYKKVFIYLEKNCTGFKNYCKEENIAIAS